MKRYEIDITIGAHSTKMWLDCETPQQAKKQIDIRVRRVRSAPVRSKKKANK